MKKIYCVYFTNPGRIDLLKMSLKSLDLLNHRSIAKKVFVYLTYITDKKQVFKIKEEITALNLKLKVKVVVRKYFNKYSGGRTGLKDFNPVMRVHLEINEAIWDDPNAIICQVNTDILFISDKIFDEVIESNADLIGHPCINKDHLNKNTVYVQGGIFFLKSSIIPEIINISFNKIIKEVCSVMGRQPEKCGEDILITYCVKKVGKVKYLKMQLAGKMIESLTEESLKKYSKEYSLIHFHRCSTRLEMLRVSKLLLDIKEEEQKSKKEEEINGVRTTV